MRIYITKYALTKGILVADARVDDGMAIVGTSFASYFHGEGSEWHRTEIAAVKHAEALRQRRIESLRKSLAKMESFNFIVKPWSER